MKKILTSLKQLRQSRGLSQSDLAAKLGLSRPSFSAIEQGKRELTLSEAELLSHALGVSVKELEGGATANYEKYKQMILAFLRCAGEKDSCIPKTKLAKLVYLADFAWFYTHLESMSGMPYRRIQYGPVPDAYFRAVDELYEQGSLDIRKTDGGAFLISQTRSGQRAALSQISSEEERLIAEIAFKWKGKNTQEIVAFTHNQLPYAVCAEDEIIPYELITQENPDDVY
jgi:transcriptional regulator with XRE-family HTH domain